jgi:hypothetical protein
VTADLRCVIRGEPLSDQAYACATCGITKPAGQLQAIADMLPAARDVAHGLSRRASGGGSTGKPGSRLPFDLHATSRLDAVQNELTTWVRHIASERGLVPPWVTSYGDPIAIASVWLSGQLEWMRHRREVTELVSNIAIIVRVMRSLVAGPRDHEYLGPCGAPLGGCTCPRDPDDEVDPGDPISTCPTHGWAELGTCEGDIYAPRGASVGRCRTCGAEVASEDRRAWLDAEIRSQAFRAIELAQAYDINVNTIRSWAARGHLKSYWRTSAGLIAPWSEVAEDADAIRLHYAGDVLDLAAADAARRAGEQAKRQRRKDTAA